MKVLAIDPGTTHSAWVEYDGTLVYNFGFGQNEALLATLREMDDSGPHVVACEWIEAMGMAVGREVFETCCWVGRFMEARQDSESGGEFQRVTRREVKLHLCGSMKAKDANIRQALIDKFGGSAAIGRKASPGPLFGISGHIWSALAVAVTHFDKANF